MSNTVNIKEQTWEITDFMLDKLKAASDQGEEQIMQFLSASAYVTGYCVALAAANPGAIGPLMSKSIEALTDGIQSGMQFSGMDGTFIKIVRD